MFQVAGISKSFGGHALFTEVTFRIDITDRIGLVGPNGVGKTTLLKILVGEEPADDGQFAIPKTARVGYLAQEVRADTTGTVLLQTMNAVPEVGEIEKEMARLEAEMGSAPRDVAAKLALEHGELLDRYQQLDGYTMEARAREILAGLGFSETDLDKPLRELSGGWGMRVELAKLLLAQPDLLLLDEPTNHLDLESMEWLEAFLQGYKGAWVVVSHDRYFLNRMVNKIVDLGLDPAFMFPGNYDAFIAAREEIDIRLAKEAATREKRMDEIKQFVERFRAKATKARQAQSRSKMLEKMQKEMDENAPAVPRRRKAMRVKLPEPDRSGDIPIQLTDVGKSYGDNVVYTDLNFHARRGDKVALVGLNGAGKTTMLKLLAGSFPPDQGSRQLGHNTTAYYFAQHQVDTLNVSNTVLAELWDEMSDEVESRVRGILGAFLFSGDDVDKRVGVLSGGEKSRLALAKMLAKPRNLLLLDEPTNHLDLQSREVLEHALRDYQGTIVFISHDRYFINEIATKVAEIRVGGQITIYPGDYDYYMWKRAELEAKPKPKPKKAAASENKPKPKQNQTKQSSKAARDAQKATERKNAKRKKEAAAVESKIQVGEARMKEIDALLCDPEVYTDATQCKELLAEREDLQRRVDRMYAQWEKLAT